MKLLTAVSILVLIVGLSACGRAATQAPAASPPPVGTPTSAAGPSQSEARVLGIIDFQADQTTDVISAPTTVRASQPFTITITTFGGGCERASDTAVLLAESSAAVMVYDLTTATQPEVACTAMLKRLPHTANLRFSTPGEALIQVWGRRVGPETPRAGVPTVLEQRVRVE